MTSQNLSDPPVERTRATATTTRIGAGLGLASVVVLLAGFALVAPAGAVHTNPVEEVVGFYTGGSQTANYVGGLVGSVGLLLFLPFAAMLTARLRGPGVSGDVLAPTAQMAATAYVVLTQGPRSASSPRAASPDADGELYRDKAQGLYRGKARRAERRRWGRPLSTSSSWDDDRAW